MNKLLVICGPTATGKTGLAVKLAKKFNGELISADSRQVYQGMNIGTGKDHPKEVKINLIDVVKPNQEFSVAQYYQLAWQAIKRIWKKGKLPILVGGTGFYIKAVVDGLATKEIPPNSKVRQGMKNWTASQLFQYLEKLDPLKAATLNKSDRANPRRLIRAIEIVLWKKENPNWQPRKHEVPLTLFIGLKTNYKRLYKKIDKRVNQRMEAGAEKEVRSLIKKNYSWDLPAMSSMGYIQWQSFFEGKITKEEVIERWQFDEHAYARRQMTWFRRNKQIHWFDIEKKKWQDKVAKLVGGWLVNGRSQKN